MQELTLKNKFKEYTNTPLIQNLKLKPFVDFFMIYFHIFARFEECAMM